MTNISFHDLTPNESLPKRIHQDHIDIWRIWLDHPPISSSRLWEVLDLGERARAGSFRFEHDRERYIVHHGMLRVILSTYVGKKPEQLKLVNGLYGKPHLDCLQGEGLEFNCSHSDGLAVIAVTCGRPIGVDVQSVKPVPESDLLLRELFSIEEYPYLENSPSEKKLQVFYELWTLKEAHLKAIGCGFALDGYPGSTVSTSEDLFPTDLFRENRRKNLTENIWSSQIFSPAEGFLAAVVTR